MRCVTFAQVSYTVDVDDAPYFESVDFSVRAPAVWPHSSVATPISIAVGGLPLNTMLYIRIRASNQVQPCLARVQSNVNQSSRDCPCRLALAHLSFSAEKAALSPRPLLPYSLSPSLPLPLCCLSLPGGS